MSFFDFCRRKVQCITCREYHFKRDCYKYAFQTWAGDMYEYECKVCDTTRKFDGKPLRTWAVRVDAALLSGRSHTGM